jgi:hypothetical protein
MALVDLTKQLAKEALLSATRDPSPAPSQADSAGSIGSLGPLIVGQIGSMQKALREDEELVVWFQNGAERIRVIEVIMPSWRLAILSGLDADRNLTRVISGVESLQLVAKVMKLQPGVKATRVGLVTPKPKDSSA